mgnify:CR=1 FL=1
MRLYLDSAVPEEIRRGLETGLFYGVTMNPFLLRNHPLLTSMSFTELVKMLEPLVEKEFHVQVPGNSFEELVKNALKVHAINPEKIFIKIPATPEGFKAISLLKKKGVRITVTAITSPAQAVLAALLGAEYVAPFTTRVYELGGDGMGLLRKILHLYRTHGVSTMVIAASIRSVDQVLKAFALGSHAVTIKYSLLQRLLLSEQTEEIVKEMNEAWKNIKFE